MSGAMAIVPVKPLNEGKSRLRTAMSDCERSAFLLRLLERTVEICQRALGPGRTLVVSRDPGVLRVARRLGALHIEEKGRGGLNRSLAGAIAEAKRLGADAALILPVDLAGLSVADIRAMLDAAVRGSVVIAPDHRERGTNALLLSPPDVIDCCFGRGSFAAHLAAARRAEIDPVVVRRAGLALDIDTPADLARTLGMAD